MGKNASCRQTTPSGLGVAAARTSMTANCPPAIFTLAVPTGEASSLACGPRPTVGSACLLTAAKQPLRGCATARAVPNVGSTRAICTTPNAFRAVARIRAKREFGTRTLPPRSSVLICRAPSSQPGKSASASPRVATTRRRFLKASVIAGAWDGSNGRPSRARAPSHAAASSGGQPRQWRSTPKALGACPRSESLIALDAVQSTWKNTWQRRR